ncbi:unnamed protein product, partial [Meganyctiphanes norvegica]
MYTNLSQLQEYTSTVSVQGVGGTTGGRSSQKQEEEAMIVLWAVLATAASLFHHTASVPGLNSRDLLPPTRTNTQDISEGAQGYHLLPVSAGLHKRRLLWFFGKDDEEEISAPDGPTTTERPSRWSRWMGKVGNGFKKIGRGIKSAANTTKWKMKQTGSKIGRGIKSAANTTKWKFKKAGSSIKGAFKSGYRKIKMKIS